ncbi:hypothetical protein D9611_008300 [Ephemerocybe angulata]|uniref:Uncharacterized protein n=1 Tax=Ephemerocybe angulata TaxID=980116 RepID=A0A8H5BK77_9AGAR|nr:hypothetical protein D9611_008300 [Tulosesus angulatus]
MALSEGGPSTTTSPSPPTARLGVLPSRIHRLSPHLLNIQHRCALGPVDDAEDTVAALTSERLSVYLKAQFHPNSHLEKVLSR